MWTRSFSVPQSAEGHRSSPHAQEGVLILGDLLATLLKRNTHNLQDARHESHDELIGNLLHDVLSTALLHHNSTHALRDTKSTTPTCSPMRSSKATMGNVHTLGHPHKLIGKIRGTGTATIYSRSAVALVPADPTPPPQRSLWKSEALAHRRSLVGTETNCSQILSAICPCETKFRTATISFQAIGTGTATTCSAKRAMSSMFRRSGIFTPCSICCSDRTHVVWKAQHQRSRCWLLHYFCDEGEQWSFIVCTVTSLKSGRGSNCFSQNVSLFRK